MSKRDTKKGTKAPEAPRVDADETLEQIKSLSRQPFQEILSRLLSAEPTKEQVAAFAAKYPDRWAQCCAIFARPSGFSEKLNIEADVSFRAILNLSDCEKLLLIKAYEEQQQKTIDVTPTQTPAEPQPREGVASEPSRK